jgi:2-dehydro-3-deoxyphosphogluconate aldolase / (4S)-4-hydroxy-2-oxoglutarate aldolase
VNRQDVCGLIEETGLVAVVRAPSAELALRAVELVVGCGITIIEVTLTVPGALSVMRSLVETFKGRAVVGAGTVLGTEEVTACIDAGAAFVVSPGLVPGLVEAAHAKGVAAIPGALTPTEVLAALRAGADMVKIFPCGAVGGPEYLRALRGPLPRVKLIPTGGITAATLPEYFAAGAAAVGMGSELVNTKALVSGGDGLLSERAQQLVAAVRIARAPLAPRTPSP